MPRSLAPEFSTISNESVPVPETLFARICRASAHEARELALPLPSGERARLALFCNARTHLREVGRAIAGACSIESLTLEGGHAGLVLFGQVNAGPETWGSASRSPAKRITLAG